MFFDELDCTVLNYVHGTYCAKLHHYNMITSFCDFFLFFDEVDSIGYSIAHKINKSVCTYDYVIHDKWSSST